MFTPSPSSRLAHASSPSSRRWQKTATTLPKLDYVDFVKASKINKAMTGHFAKSNVPPVKMIKEVRRSRSSAPAKAGDSGRKMPSRLAIAFSSISSPMNGSSMSLAPPRVAAFAGVIRRHGFGGGPKSHGHMFQVQGSIGASSFPSRVFPGQRMPGHMGHAQITVRNLRIRGIDVEDNLILVEGAVPGPRDGFVLISKAKAPPRERRGFAGAATKDALKASKKAAPSKKK